jgi:flagellar hook-length control protein FliK
MQVDFNPIPASGDLMTADVPPPGGDGLAKVSPAKGGQSDGSRGQQGVGRRKDFHETMDEVLRPDAAGRAKGQDLEDSGGASSEVSVEGSAEGSAEVSAEASKEASNEDSNKSEESVSLAEGLIVALEAHQKGAPVWIKAELGPGSQSEASLKGALPQSDSAPEFLADKANTASPQLANAGMATVLEGTADAAAAAADKAGSSTPEMQKPGEPSVSPVKVDLAGKVADTKVSVVSTEAEAGNLAEGEPAFKMGGDPNGAGTRIWMDGGSRPSAAQAGVEARVGQSLADSGHPDLPQEGANPQGLTKAAAASTAAPSATPEEGQPQSFASLVENLEKGGGEGQHLKTDADTSLDTVGPSSSRGHTTSQSASVNASKAEPTPSQALPKEAVVQQIVDSAKLRLVNGQSEMRIQLKPEHLGRVQLRIATEQQQVVVKVMAELPVVKELLESNLHQLRTELQGQGLEIHKFDVSVGSDGGSQNREQPTWAQQRSGHRGGGFAKSEPEHGEGGSESQAHRPQVAPRPVDGVDYFA